MPEPSLEEDQVTEPKSNNQFILANTAPISIGELRGSCIIPSFAKDNESTISHSHFIEAVYNAAQMTFDKEAKAVFPAKPKAMYSKIDLLQGDITSIYDPEFITGEYTDLKEFHQDRESQGQEIIQNNIQTLVMC